ncbi:hypothetical protein LJC22_03810 [Desulfosarcina sp. OttesenSCG-928-G10]|nr:hypothetical protein [Desulfosarcina sp. OttesenSCG-928-G10]
MSRAFAILKQNPVVFFTMTVIAIVPAAILEILFSESPAVIAFSGILNTILSLVIQGAIAYAVFMAFKGGPVVSINDAVSKGMARLGPLVLAAILMGLGVGIGMLLLIIPGIILLCVWAVTIPACVVEGLGAIDSMKRSAELTKGYRGAVFGLALIIGLITFVFVGGCAALGGAMGAPVVGGLLAAVLSIPLTAFSSVMYAVIYYDLRMIKEGVSIDKLANVFD